jgi:hypothetical protein
MAVRVQFQKIKTLNEALVMSLKRLGAKTN